MATVSRMASGTVMSMLMALMVRLEVSIPSSDRIFGSFLGTGLGLGRAVEEEPRQEERQPQADKVDGDAGDGLVALQVDGSHRMEHRHGGPRQPADQKSEPRAPGEVPHRGGDERADRHHALDADVVHTGTLGDDPAERREDEGRRIHQGDIDGKQDVIDS